MVAQPDKLELCLLPTASEDATEMIRLEKELRQELREKVWCGRREEVWCGRREEERCGRREEEEEGRCGREVEGGEGLWK